MVRCIESVSVLVCHFFGDNIGIGIGMFFLNQNFISKIGNGKVKMFIPSFFIYKLFGIADTLFSVALSGQSRKF